MNIEKKYFYMVDLIFKFNF